MTHGSVAKKVREAKERAPEDFCPDKKCLWRTGGGPCPRHGGPRLNTFLAAQVKKKEQEKLDKAAERT